MDEFIGIVKLFSGNFAPRGWAICDGSLLPISRYSAVFSILGTTYGGDGVTTFALPDLRSRTAIGTGQGPGLSYYAEGQKSGTENVTLNATNIPPHVHPATLSVSAANATDSTPAKGGSIGIPGTMTSRTFAPTLGYNAATPDTTMNPASVTVGPNMGGGVPVPVIQPYLSMYYIICLEGLYPPRP